jgi:hypothetical protein
MPNEVRANAIRDMGEARGTMFHELWNELAWTYAKWEEYLCLFGSGEDRIQWMNSVVPRCMHQIQMAMWRDILLQICRFTDPPKSCGKENISIRALAQHLDEASLSEKYEGLVEIALQKSEFARDRRNRIYAHRDLLTARNQHPKALPEASQREVNQALAAIAAALNAVQQRYQNSTTMYEHSGGSGDAEVLVRAIKAESNRREEWLKDLKRRAEGSSDHA